MKQNYHTCPNYPKVKYKICQTWKDIKLLVKYIKETGWCVYDYETNGQMPYEPEAFPTVLGIAFQPYFTYVIPLEAVDSPFKGQTQKIHDYLNDEVFMNPKVIKVAHNMKFENTWLRRYGCDQRGITICTLLLKYTLDEERPMGLKENVARFFPEYANYEDDNARVVAKYGGWGNIPAEELAPYNALDCHVTFLLLNRLMASLLKTKTLIPLFKNLLMPLSELIAQTELKGAHVDVEYLLELDKKYRGLIEENQKKLNNLKPVRKFNKINRKVKVKKLISTIKAEIQELEAIIEEENDQTVINRKLRSIDARNEKIRRYKMGEFTTKKEIEAMGDLNFNSPNQMRDFLYGPNGLDLPIIRYTKDKKTKEESDNASTAEETLLELKEHDKYGFIDALLKHRGLTKLHSTTIAGVIERLSSNNRVHPRFLIHGTVTGRFSSQNPNFQNFPRATTNADIKKQFAAPPGFLILEGDFSQAELRVAAELSDDDAMIDIFQRGYNIHFATAVKVFDDMDNYEELYKLSKDESWEHHDMWIKRKKKAKTINFGILYGQGAKMLAEGMGVDIDEAKEFIKEWYAAFPKLTKWIKKQKRLAHKNGYVENLFGRKRRLYDLLESGEDWKIAEAERLAVNTPIQGASSDFTQLANLTVQREIRRANIPFNTVLWNTVHDSIIFYIKPQFIHRVVPIIHNIAIQPETQRWFGFEMKKVPMKFSFEVGKTWGELHEYDPNEDYTKWVDNYYNKYNTKLHYGIVE